MITSRCRFIKFLGSDNCLSKFGGGGQRSFRKASKYLLWQVFPSDDIISPVVSTIKQRSTAEAHNPTTGCPRLGLQDFVAFMNSTEFWRKQRRAMNASLNKKSVLGFRAAQELEARKLLQRLLSCSVELESSDELNLELHRLVPCPVIVE